MGTNKKNEFECDVCCDKEYEVIYKYKVPTPKPLRDYGVSIARQLEHVICTRCGFITIFPNPSEEEINSYYATTPTPSPEAFLAKTPIYDEAEAFIRKHVTQAKAIIEVGSSYGHFLQRFREYTSNLIGIEPSGKCCEYARNNYGIAAICSLLETLDLQKVEGKADLVICSHVIEHSLSPRNFMQRLSELLNWNCYLYIEVPSTELLASCQTPWFQNIFFGHLSHFIEHTLRLLALNAGFKEIETVHSYKTDYPSICSIFQKVNRYEISKDLFMQQTRALDGLVHSASGKAMKILQANKRVAFWGIGDDFVPVWQNTTIPKAAEAFFIDKFKFGKQFAGRKILKPQVLCGLNLDILVVTPRSHLTKQAILNDLKQSGYKGQVEFLYEDQS